MNRFCLALLFAGIGVVVSNAFDEKIIFPDLFAFSASNEPLTWIEAIQFCERQGSSLVEIHDATQRDKVNEFLSKTDLFGDRLFWIGLSDLFHEGAYRWGNNCTPPTFTDWNAGEPNDTDGLSDCVHLEYASKGRRWNDNPCTSRMYALCQRV